jgi:catechol 2,3-dioxygenase-like lactoylglutathione lyase family enzyme
MSHVPFTAIDHFQMAIPPGQEDVARSFYCDLLGMTEIPKPPELKKNGGAWFTSGDVQVHIGVDPHFHPATKAHPALRCGDYAGLLEKLRAADHEIVPDRSIPGVERCHILDPFGNRIELIAEQSKRK